MTQPCNSLMRLGDWCVDPVSGQISRNAESTRLEARAMRLLLCLAERQGEVVSIEELLGKVWAGVNVSQDSVYQAVTSLRRQLEDDPKQPKYIETVPRLGYRMVADVGPWDTASLGSRSSAPLLKSGLTWAAIALLSVAEVAKSLGVAYVLDGSVRKSGSMVRVAARLTRTGDGFVVWSETYDRRFEDLVMVQDDIASEVAKALRSSIGAG